MAFPSGSAATCVFQLFIITPKFAHIRIKAYVNFNLQSKTILCQLPSLNLVNRVFFFLIIFLCRFILTGGFGSYLFAMSETIAKQATEANNPQNIKNPRLSWMIGYLLVVSFLGLFSLVPLRKVLSPITSDITL